MKASTVKATGYLISIVSVALLGAVSWKKAQSDPFLAICLFGGMTTSIIGMFLRWFSYELEKKAKAKVD